MPNKMIEEIQKKSEMQKHQTIRIIHQMLNDCKEINYYTVSEAAGVSRPFLYRYSEISSLIDACRISGLSKRELQQEVIRLRFQKMELERRLSDIAIGGDDESDG